MIKDKAYYETQATEEEFLDWYKNTDVKTYEKPSLTIDSVMFAFDKGTNDLKVLLIKRKAHPFKDSWALPGGFVDKNEDTDGCCLRETEEETGLKLDKKNIEQLYTFSKPGRDPRTWVISVAYMTFLPTVPEITHGSDAKEAKWFSVNVNKEQNTINLISDEDSITMTFDGEYTEESKGRLAFDHNDILSMAINRVQGKLDYNPTALNVLGNVFKMVEARKVYAKFMGLNYKSVDNSNFKKTHGHLFEEVGESSEKTVGRPAKVFKLRG